MTDAALAKAFTKLRHKPLDWVMFAYPWGVEGTPLAHDSGPEQWQSDLLGHIGDQLQKGVSPIRIAARSGHGVGKSSLMGMLRGWAMSTCMNTRGIVTANTGAQLATKTLPEFSKWHGLQINKHWFDGTNTYRYILEEDLRDTWRFDAITWSAENPAAFAGLHNQGYRILLEFDEASEIHRSIWETAEGALTDQNTEILWIAFGNPTQSSGRFLECFGAHRNLWHTIEIDARSVRRTNKRLIEEWAHHYGEDSDFFRVRVKGEAPRVASMQFIGSELVNTARARVPYPLLDDPLIYGVDVARFGDDQSVIAKRRGFDAQSLPWHHFREADTMTLAGRIAEEAEREKPDAIFIDESGIGAGVVDRCRQLRVRGVLGVHFGARADFGPLTATGAPLERYHDKRAEMWGGMRQWLRAGCIVSEPQLRDDLCGGEYGFDRDGRIQLERKEDAKKRGLASPDWGDALALTFSYPVQGSNLGHMIRRRQRQELDPWAPMTEHG